MADPAQLYDQLKTAFRQHRWSAARALAGQLLPRAPRHAGANYMAGIAHLELQQMPQALEYLRRAANLEPACTNFVVQYAKALVLAHKNRDAKAVADHALALTPDDPVMLDTLGVIFTQVGDYPSAAATFRQAVALAPTHAAYRYNLATALLVTGELDTAERELEACVRDNPEYWQAHLSLAQLRRQTPASNHVQRLLSLLSSMPDTAGDNNAPMCLNMALAKEYEDLADYPAAFAHLRRGKSAARVNRHYSIARDEAVFAAIMAAFPEPQAIKSGCPTAEPIFIIGMPRSGTTLVERIISSHPDVHSAGELLNFGMAVKHVSGSRTAALIDSETITLACHADCKRLGEIYLASTRPGSASKPRFIDKFPHNFLYAGFIAHALPNAKIICLRRDPMDTCLSNFRQLFAPKSPYFDYSFDLLDTGRYYVLFDRLMAHWQKVLPGRILEIDYEALIDKQEASSRQLLAFCGLPWDDACLHFEENPAPVATASVVQVRAPIYRSSLKRWKKYEPQLRELKALLQEAEITLVE